MTRPTGRFIGLFALAFGPALLPVFVADELWTVWIAAVAAAAGLLLADLVLAPSPRQVVAELELPEQVFIGATESWVLRLAHEGRRSLRLEMKLDHAPEIDLEYPEEVRLAPRRSETLAARITAHRRGTWPVSAVWLRWRGPLGLIERTVSRPLEIEVPVTPNTRAVRAAALRFFSNPDFQSGLKIEHYLGDGSEFDRLREFMVGMDPRAIDWKASARHRKLMACEFRAERNHDVVLALDTGRLMGEPVAGIPRLDHAINALLLMAWGILKTGDRVGLFAFDDTVRTWLRPLAGVGSLRILQQRVAALDYGEGETNFTLGLSRLQTESRRRSLVVVVTEFADTITAELMVENVLRLNRRHLVVFVALRDTELEDMADARPNSSRGLHRTAVAGGLVRDRRRVLARLARHGVRCLDVTPENLSTRLLNEYLDIKRRELV